MDRIGEREVNFGIQAKSQRFKVEIRRLKNEKIFLKNRRKLKTKLFGINKNPEMDENIEYVNL